MSEITLLCGDCLEIMPTLPSVDAILTDIPYGTTACKWDTVIPFPDLWRVVKYVLKPKGVFVTTASQPFTSALVMSNPDWFRYEWIWDKQRGSDFLNANRKPLESHDDIIIFSQNGHQYNPQYWYAKPYKRTPNGTQSDNYGKRKTAYTESKDGKRFPKTVIGFPRDGNRIHPTQKPVALYEYLIRTYTNEGDTVLDMCMGSGTTGVACVNTNRNFIGIEKDPTYFAIAEKRIKEAQAQLTLNL
jgi:site-specific DNA-methyltransferase (adenine-specific)